MTEVVVSSNARGEYRISAKGHASGEDPAPCAGITAILGALAGYLENSGKFMKGISRLDPGDAYIYFVGGIEAAAVFEMAVIGLLQIELTYPEYIKVEKK